MIFLLGAGFNVDARRFVRSVNADIAYPTVADLARVCFELDSLPPGTSIEMRFQEAIDAHNNHPIEQLCYHIMKADYYLTESDAILNGSLSFYLNFLDAFPESPILTFNYDGLLEILLLRSKQWRPEDGWGVGVKTEYFSDPANSNIPATSLRQIIHLHGSFYVLTQEYDAQIPETGNIRLLHRLAEPLFLFQPDEAGHRFMPFERAIPKTNFVRVSERIIAPVPDKANGLKQVFIKAMYERALAMMEDSNDVVSIGYRFSQTDESSYGPLLGALAKRRGHLHVITPDACEIVGRIASKYDIEYHPIACGFAEWARRGFRI